MKISPASLNPYSPIGGAVSLRDLEGSTDGSFVSIDGSLHNCESPLEFYRSKGTGGFRDLLGEFVFVLWDFENRRFVCARDRVGVKSFFYHFDGQTLFFSACLTDLVKMCGVSFDVDEETIAFALVNDWTDLERTFYKGVFRLPPAHFLSLTGEGIEVRPYWQFRVGGDIRYPNETQYIDHLQSLLREAVRCRLPKNEKRFGITVSGGIDSSVVACLADDLRPGSFEALSMYYDAPEADDREAMEFLVSEKKWPHHIVYPERSPKEMEMSFEEDYRDVVYHPEFFVLRPLYQAANKLGLSTLFNGHGGDDIFSPPLASRLFLLRNGGWPQLLRSFLPSGLPRMIRRAVHRKAPYWVAPGLADRYPLMTRMGEKFRENRIFPKIWQRDLYNQLFLWGGNAFDFEQDQLLARLYGLQLSYPLFDWRLIDYAFRIPAALFYQKGWSKWIFRQAAKGIVPDRLCFQKDPYDSRGNDIKAIERQASVFQNWVDDSLLVKEGFIDEKGLQKLWGQRNLVSFWEPLFNIFTFEKWLRTLRGREGFKVKKKTKGSKGSTEAASPRAKYQSPVLTKYGSVRQFTRATPFGLLLDKGKLGKKTHKTCIGPLSEIEEHRILLSDRETQDRFRAAIFETVRKGDVVLDLGTGSGLHAFFACQAGAKKVYAIESGTVIELARAAAEENGFIDRIEFIYGLAEDVTLPERVDVILTNTGFITTLEDLPAACKRFLKPGGRIVPSQARLSFVPVEIPKVYDDKVSFWSPEHYGLSFRAFESYASNHPHITHIQTQNFLAAPVALPAIDYTSAVPRAFNWTAEFTIERAGSIHGLAGWYTFQLSAGTELSTRPPLKLSPELWFHPFLPLQAPVRVEVGQRVKVELGFYLDVTAHDPIWTWKLEVGGKTVASQTSFNTIPLSPALLAKLSH